MLQAREPVHPQLLRMIDDYVSVSMQNRAHALQEHAIRASLLPGNSSARVSVAAQVRTGTGHDTSRGHGSGRGSSQTSRCSMLTCSAVWPSIRSFSSAISVAHLLSIAPLDLAPTPSQPCSRWTIGPALS